MNSKANKQWTMALLALLVLLPSAASLEISEISHLDPLLAGSVQTLTVRFNSSTSITSAVVQVDGTNRTLEVQPSVRTYSWTVSQIGVNKYTVFASNAANETVQESAEFLVVDSTVPSIVESSPAGVLTQSLIELRAVTSEDTTCKYDLVNMSYDSMRYEIPGSGQTHSVLRTFEDGEHNVFMSCMDQARNIASKMVSFTVDATAPSITFVSPTGSSQSRDITLQMSTDEAAVCRWSLQSQDYAAMSNVFNSTGGTVHSQPITLTTGQNTIYLSCADIHGNAREASGHTVSYNVAPAAAISFVADIEDRIKAGTYEIRLTTTESLAQPPSLRLVCNGRNFNIPVEGSTNTWSGFLVLPEDAGECPGEFAYEGIDQFGTIGRTIDSGKLVLVDTRAPPPPLDVRLVGENSSVRVSWTYEGEEDVSFRVYRSTTGNTDVSHFLSAADTFTYVDRSVSNKIGYYYRVSAIDEAGNEGALSSEVFLMVSYLNESIIDPQSLLTINSRLSEYELALSGLQSTQDDLDQVTEPAVRMVLSQKGILGDLESRIGQLRTLIGEVKTFKELGLGASELSQKLSATDAKVSKLKQGAVKAVSVKNKLSLEQSYDELAARQAIDVYLEGKQFTQAQKEAYISRALELQKAMRVGIEIIEIEIESMDGSTTYATAVDKTISTPADLSQVIFQEVLPKNKVRYNDFTFASDPQDLNSEGPIWRSSSIQENGLSYLIDRLEDVEVLGQIRTVALVDVESFLNSIAQEGPAEGQITGAVAGPTFSLETYAYAGAAVVIVILLLLYYVMLSKPSSPVEAALTRTIEACYEALAKEDWEEVRALYAKAYAQYELVDARQKHVWGDKMAALYGRIVQKANGASYF